MSRLKTIARRQAETPALGSGHSLCQGCGVPMVVRTILGSIETPVVVISATGCLEVATIALRTPPGTCPGSTSRSRTPRRLQAASRRRSASCNAVDGSPTSRSPSSQSQATEALTTSGCRRFQAPWSVAIGSCMSATTTRRTWCGVQRSGATPFGAGTTTSPVGLESFGKAQQRKDMTAIAVAHHVPYVGQACGAHWFDLSRVEQAVVVDSPAFLNVLTDCPVGWGHEPRLGPRILAAAVETTFWPLYEVVDGSYRLTYEPAKRLPVEDWLAGQALRPPPPARKSPPRRPDPAPDRRGLGHARRQLHLTLDNRGRDRTGVGAAVPPGRGRAALLRSDPRRHRPRRRAAPREVAGEIAALLGLTRFGVVLVASGALFLVGTGLWLVEIWDGVYSLGDGWIAASLGLLALSFVLGAIGGQKPKQARQLAEGGGGAERGGCSTTGARMRSTMPPPSR